MPLSMKLKRIAGASAVLLALSACQTYDDSAPFVTVEAEADAAVETADVEVATETVADTKPAQPVAAVFSEEGIAALEARMAQYLSDGQLYGIHTRLVSGGEVISDFKAGVRSVQPISPLENDTIYRIYSMTKPVTGVAMMMLWEEGAFKLDDPVTTYIPEFEGLRVLDGLNEDGSARLAAPDHVPTMREVMSHTAGFAYGLSGTDPANDAFRTEAILRAPDLQTFIDKVANVPLLFQPGEAWAYSASVDIQGYLVQKLSGQSFGEFLQARIFAPLGMTDTAFYVSEEDYDRFSQVYGYNPEDGQLVPVPYPSVQFRKETVAFESGGGGLVATMDDYGRFAQMLLNGGTLDGVRLLKEETVTLMRTNILPEDIYLSTLGQNQGDKREGLGFGLGLGVVTDPAAGDMPYPEGVYFWGGAASTWFWNDPVNDFYFIGMVQIFEQGGPELLLRETSADLVYEAMED